MEPAIARRTAVLMTAICNTIPIKNLVLADVDFRHIELRCFGPLKNTRSFGHSDAAMLNGQIDRPLLVLYALTLTHTATMAATDTHATRSETTLKELPTLLAELDDDARIILITALEGEHYLSCCGTRVGRSSFMRLQACLTSVAPRSARCRHRKDPIERAPVQLCLCTAMARCSSCLCSQIPQEYASVVSNKPVLMKPLQMDRMLLRLK